MASVSCLNLRCFDMGEEPIPEGDLKEITDGLSFCLMNKWGYKLLELYIRKKEGPRLKETDYLAFWKACQDLLTLNESSSPGSRTSQEFIDSFKKMYQTVYEMSAEVNFDTEEFNKLQAAQRMINALSSAEDVNAIVGIVEDAQELSEPLLNTVYQDCKDQLLLQHYRVTN